MLPLGCENLGCHLDWPNDWARQFLMLLQPLQAAATEALDPSLAPLREVGDCPNRAATALQQSKERRRSPLPLPLEQAVEAARTMQELHNSSIAGRPCL